MSDGLVTCPGRCGRRISERSVRRHRSEGCPAFTWGFGEDTDEPSPPSLHSTRDGLCTGDSVDTVVGHSSKAPQALVAASQFASERNHSGTGRGISDVLHPTQPIILHQVSGTY